MGIEAMKQALNALVRVHVADNDCDFLNDSQCNQVTHAIAALRTAIQQAEAQRPATPEPVDFPAGAIVNGRTLMDRIEAYPFESEGGDLRMCSDWHELRRCFEHLADYVSSRPAPSAPADVVRDAIASVREQYRGTDWGKAAECICDAIDTAMLAAKEK